MAADRRAAPVPKVKDMYEPGRVRNLKRPQGLPFRIGKLGHVVLNVRDVERSARFYTEVLGFQISDVYPEDMVPGGMVFLRCNPDHHGIALVGSMKAEAPNVELNHIAFEVATLDEVVRARDHLHRHGITIDFVGRRRAGCQLAVEFRDPDNHRLEIYWGIDQIGSDGHVRPSTEWKGAQSLEQAIADPVRGQDTTLHDLALLNGEKSLSTR
jgi:catechol 2,3-dioxygenase-like lactoylglutathione lyase family enzyme